MTNLSVILGRRRQGKSTLALSVAFARHNTVVFWDLNNQINGFPYTTDDPATVEQWLAAGEEPILIVVKGRRGDLKGQLAELVPVLFPWEDVAFVCDEASDVQSAAWIDESLEHLVRRWNDDSSLIQATHRLADTNPIVRQNATDFYLFHTNYAPDLVVIERHFGDLAQLVPQLKRYECIHFWLDSGGEVRYTKWDDPVAWYLPLRLSEA